MKSFLITFAFLICSAASFSQPTRVINAGIPNSSLSGNDVFIDLQNNHIMSTVVSENNLYTGRITVLDYSYTPLWTAAIDSLGFRYNGNIIELGNGEYIATFQSGFETGGVIAKFDLNGMIWVKRVDYNGSIILDAEKFNNGNIALIIDNGSSSISTDLVILDSNGDQVWNGNNSLNIDSQALTRTVDGNMIMISRDPGVRYLTKIDPNGGTIWTKSYDVSVTVEHDYDVIESSTGNIYTVGYRDSLLQPSGASTDMFARKFDSNGDFVAAAYYDSEHFNYARGLVELNSGDMIMVGYSYPGTSQPNVAFLKIDTNLQLVDSKVYGSSTGAANLFTRIHKHGDFIYSLGKGWYNSSIPGLLGQATLVITNPDLELPCAYYEQNFTTVPLAQEPFNPTILSFTPTVVDFNDGAYTTASHMQIFDACSDEILNLKNDENSTISLFPNPVSNTLIISNDNSSSIQEVKLIDLAGKLHLHNNQVNSKEFMLDVSSLKDGIYFVSIKTENDLLTQKIIVNH